MTPAIRLTAALLVALTVVPATAWARPAHKQALADYFGPFLSEKLNDCRTCHLPDKPGAKADEKPHNPFGARIAAVKKELLDAGKKATLVDRLEALADEDSDGDRVSNLLEILSGHAPGDPNDRPTAIELAKTRDTLAAFLKSKNAYPWTPFEKVKRPAVPQVKDTAWVRNPIDAFIAVEHESRGLKPRPETPKPVLLRRLYLDLVGLPPTPEELHAFLDDKSPDAYEKVVDRLLASPQYGERWGRHWMDVWRYSDWAGWGNQVRDSQPHIWHWRDWIIESLNEDRPYDRMILEMLAADELTPDDLNALRATGYLVRNFKLLSREKWMLDTVDHTAQAFLAVTLGCARCHDHMYDPITQKEYYQIRSIFEPHQVRTDRIPGQPNVQIDGIVRAYDANPDVATYLFVRGDDRTPDKTAAMKPGVPAALGGKPFRVEPVSLPVTARLPDKREFVIRENRLAAETSVTKAREGLEAARLNVIATAGRFLAGDPLRAAAGAASLTKLTDALTLAEADVRLAEARLTALDAVLRVEKLEDGGDKTSDAWKQVATETATAQRTLAVLEAKRNLIALQQQQRSGATPQLRADAAKNLPNAQKALATAEANAKMPATTAYTPRPMPVYPSTSTGRRLALAKWIADVDNPLTARVAMNHVWMRHFGQPLVPSVFDFGRNGRPPSHPALLDWLAAEFMDRKWSMKAMHRLMVTSSTYRLASTPDDAAIAIDRDNKWLWRANSRRVEAEVVRDCVFYVAGKLDLTRGGPDIDAKLGLTTPRRSLYFRHAAEKQMEFLKLFDAATVTECYQRKESIMPQQALALSNSDLVLQHAKILAGSLAEKAKDETAFVAMAFERVLSRPPTDAERAECGAFLRQQPGAKGREGLVHVLLNHHEFVTVR